MPDRVVVRVPATVANLGPGFDCLGMAIAWHNELRVERADVLTVTATGPGADLLPRDASNLTVRAAERVLPGAPLRIHQLVGVLPGRGFGSSAAAICGGLVAARALGETGHSDDDLLAIAIDMEGHADNVAPCLLGGITVSGAGRTLRLDPPQGLRPLVVASPGALATHAARAALGNDLPRADAAETIGRAAVLTAALASGSLDAVFDATEDVFHQPQRFALMPDTGALVRGLRRAGIAAFLSGAGPSVAALVATGGAAEAEQIARGLAPDGWDVRLESFDRSGAEVVDRR